MIPNLDRKWSHTKNKNGLDSIKLADHHFNLFVITTRTLLAALSLACLELSLGSDKTLTPGKCVATLWTELYASTKKTIFFPGKNVYDDAVDHRKGEKPEVVMSLNLVVPGHAQIRKANFLFLHLLKIE